MKRSNLIWLGSLFLGIFIIWGISAHYQFYSEEPHLSKPQQAALNITLLSQPQALPSLEGKAGANTGSWFGLLLQPTICDAICQGESIAFEQSGQVVIRPSSPLYKQIAMIMEKEGYHESQGLLLLVNPKGQFAGSIAPPYGNQKIEEAFKALNE
ncbi:hypothetical protein MSP8887_04066 [Marinomonas spartinae]|uniref:hypothetical protein n=1 Tax=Marinomonas spartinae TaxID=1792290 RepID=UPI000808ACF8|nr:hypothetical protein [Marinomonas spartinae]SBS39899.1 hypothetical protein MSP8887_04066 [Marinomonas spartinae]